MPGICTEVHWGKRLAATSVELELIDADRLAELLGDAWERKAPNRLTSSA
jgi:hypothetical protein